MCAIIDANAASEVFGPKRPEAGVKFFEWLNTGRGKLVVGGKLRDELGRVSKFQEWALEATRSGRILSTNAEKVATKTEEIKNAATCKSNDPHVLALAQVSGARLLYSNDSHLHSDFKRLIDKPRGKIYSTLTDKTFTNARRKLLSKVRCRSR